MDGLVLILILVALIATLTFVLGVGGPLGCALAMLAVNQSKGGE